MSWNETQFAEYYGVSKKFVKKCIDEGYLGNVTQNPVTKEYCIEENTPCPYKASPKITKVGTLIQSLLDAAGHNESVFPTMFQRIPKKVYQNRLNELIQIGWIEKIETESGVPYLSQTVTYYQYIVKGQNEGKLKKALEYINSIASIVSLFDVIKMFMP